MQISAKLNIAGKKLIAIKSLTNPKAILSIKLPIAPPQISPTPQTRVECLCFVKAKNINKIAVKTIVIAIKNASLPLNIEKAAPVFWV